MTRSRLTSIVGEVRQSVITIALLLTIPVVTGLVTMLLYSGRYQAMIRRMDRAVELKPAVEATLAENMFSVVAGRTAFEDSGAERLIGLCLDLAKRSAPDRELTPDRMAKLLTESRRELVVHIFQWLRERGGCHEDMVPLLAKAPRETAAALFMMYAVD